MDPPASPWSSARTHNPRGWLKYGLLAVLGLLTGIGAAAYTVKTGALASGTLIGPWQTGGDFGTADASARTRAVVALGGLLALPAREARYYTASTDDTGKPLDGHCSYSVTGGTLPGRWWSMTLYDAAGYLVPNAPGIYSVEGASLSPAERAAWTINVSPQPQSGHWLPSGGIDRLTLTLRTYLPPAEGKGDPPREALPHIRKGSCR